MGIRRWLLHIAGAQGAKPTERGGAEVQKMPYQISSALQFNVSNTIFSPVSSGRYPVPFFRDVFVYQPVDPVLRCIYNSKYTKQLAVFFGSLSEVTLKVFGFLIRSWFHVFRAGLCSLNKLLDRRCSKYLSWRCRRGQ